MALSILRYYGDRGLRLVRGRMQYVWDDKGRRYIDAHTGHGVAFLGHGNPRVVERLREQMEDIMTCSLSFRCPIQDEAAGMLERIAPRRLDVAALASTGAEAVELAIKAAWAYTGRRLIVAFRGSFHGRTLGALSITWGRRHREGFHLSDWAVFLEYNRDPSDGLRSLPEDPAAIIVEPIQGEGGVVPAEREFLRSLAEEAESRGSLLILDEIQTGFGRTGRVWAHELYGIEPDILVAGKALGGGFPVSAVFMPSDVASAIKGRHGSTYAGNPLALAALSASIEVLLEDHVPGRAEAAGGRLMKALRDTLKDHPIVRSIRGAGLMVGVDLRVSPLQMLRCMQEEGVLALRAGSTVLRLLPPYMLGSDDIVEVARVARECLCRLYGC